MIETIPPVDIFKFTKVCLCCRTPFGSNARNQRFCGVPEKECQKKYSTAKKIRRKQYQEEKGSQQIWVMAHTLSRKVMEEEVLQKRLAKKCCRCDLVEGLHVHHLDGNHLNASVTNLCYCCVPHHAELDSERKKEGSK